MLPIRKVVLYKHGVAYFEREGSVEGDASVELFFRASEMNDLLKSLTVLDADGGHVGAVGYEAQEPLEKQLADVAVSLPPQEVLTGLLSDVKGALVELAIGGRTVRGALAGIERLPRAEGERTVVEVPNVVLLVDGESLQAFDLREAKSVRLLDETLRRDLQHVLDVLLGSKRKDLKRVSILARGTGRRRVTVSYLVEAPVWKTSYRVLLGAEEKPLVQGWAIVDNTQEEDWEDVRLTLTAGLPVSFVHDLYTPRYQARPVVEVQREAAYAPPVLETGHYPEAAEEDEEIDDSRAMVADIPRVKRAMFARVAAAAPPPPPPVATRKIEVGDLFQYEIDTPVTVRRHQSALVPILLEHIDGERVSIYNPDVREKNPLSAIRFHNTTSLTLEGGPVTVLDGGAYVGEAMLDTLKSGDERIVPYSVDLGVHVAREVAGGEPTTHEVFVASGVLMVRRYHVQRTTYVLDNRNPRPVALLLDHRFLSGADLVDTPEPVERTDSFLRFRVALEPKRSQRFVVNERLLETQQHGLRHLRREEIAAFAASGWLDAATRAGLDALRAKAERQDALAREITAREQESARIVQDQGRLRQNLQALGGSSEETSLRERYVGVLSQGEDRMAVLQREVESLAAQRTALEAEIAQDIASLGRRRG